MVSPSFNITSRGEDGGANFQRGDPWGRAVANLEHDAVDASDFAAVAIDNFIVEKISHEIHVNLPSLLAESPRSPTTRQVP